MPSRGIRPAFRAVTQPNNMKHNTTPFTVTVYPIEQEPGIWFATYMISEYREGVECVVANVSMRHATHVSEANAKQAARNAGDNAVARFRQQRSAQPKAQATQARFNRVQSSTTKEIVLG
ncbi:isochorismatase [Cupriavidus sp. SW-Y-13]|uniref:isochorismatase n=1 Tax=Cupriavidus sp. SW-Y-13 TaxID=2653854 RepID=UPI001F1FE22C|nr:isochorismatase [Cupriavidus sp. SW-Y-13]